MGALTGLGFLFADLFSGGPDIPRELRLPAHSPEGLMRAGATDLVNQESEGAPPSNTLRGFRFRSCIGLGWDTTIVGRGAYLGIQLIQPINVTNNTMIVTPRRDCRPKMSIDLTPGKALARISLSAIWICATA